ncbi:hypothetical protein H0264_35760 [Nocardia huaxiensis]|uniref:Uncharacterized protein n=1 Tax=Nocardia huaxiensis TaxID=2755382 RepID=A0A7D6V8T2_9NOCA|nr:hypothetical protein [Nocardia huaxiensis]QLY30421.1 hypothetical protein H0264_35760 [Nocardia huaxiensis]
MSEPSNREVTLAIRIDTARHTQLTWIADLRGTSLKAECFRAVDAWIEAAKQDPDLMARANAARAAIEEEARARQAAIDNLFTETPPPPPDEEDETEGPVTEGVEANPTEADATVDEPSQAGRRSRGRRGGQQAGGEQSGS